MYKETVSYYLEVLFTKIDEKVDSYQKDISQKLEELKVDVMDKCLDSVETLRQDELTSRLQTLAELEERIEKLESGQIDQDNRFGTRYESINTKVIKTGNRVDDLNSRLNILFGIVGILVTGILVIGILMII